MKRPQTNLERNIGRLGKTINHEADDFMDA